MPYSDTKTRKVRSSSWTKEDERRYQAQQRRALKDAQNARLERERKLAGMTPGDRDTFLETERLKKQAEDDQKQQQVLERKERRYQQELMDSSNARLTAGAIQTEFATAIGWRERYGQPEGDWLDDPVGALTTGYGFGEEMR